MNDQPVSAAPVVRVAQNLTQIVHLAEHLLTQAVHSANDHELPGGDAMVALAPVADPSAYAENVEAAEYRHDADPLRWGEDTLDMAHEDDDMAPVLQTLWFWSCAWRDERGYPLEGRKATVLSEATFIRNCLEWAWENELHFDDFAQDIANAKWRLENVLRDGDRVVRIRVVCPDCEAGRALILQFGTNRDDDRWKCPSCKHKFDADEVRRAWAKQMRSQGAERWVPVADVISVMKAEGWRASTVRSWFDSLLIEAYCEVGTRRTAAWWPTVWHTHLTQRHERQLPAKRAADLKARKAVCADEHGEDCWVKGRGCNVALSKAS